MRSEPAGVNAPDPSTSVARVLWGALALGCLIGSIEFAATRTTAPGALLGQAVWLARLLAHWTLAAFPLGLAFLVIERRAADRIPPPFDYAVAVLIGAGVGAGVMALHGRFVDPAISQTAVGFDMSIVDRFLYGLSQLSFWGAIGAVLHSTDRRRWLTISALRRMELGRLAAERRLARSQLDALQAQVEPEFLLGVLGSLEHLYARDVAGADRVLDSLILFLREATPVLRQPTSTISKECELLRAYIDVRRAATNQQLADTFGIGAEASDVRIPPGLLLSLVSRLLNLATDPLRLLINARGAASNCTVELSAAFLQTGDRDRLSDVIEQSRRRLASTHYLTASLEYIAGAVGTINLRITLDVRGENRHVQPR